MKKTELNQLSQKAIGAAIEVHKNLGSGLPESVLQNCLFLNFSAQAVVPINYKDTAIPKEFIPDFLIEDQVVVELKSVEVLLPIHEAQLVTYLKLAEKPLGLPINFNVTKLTKGITRRVHNFPE